MSKETVRKTKMHHSFGDNMLGVVCYIIFALCALVCIYPFYYIFINTISANDLSARGVILFWPKGIHFQNYISALGLTAFSGCQDIRAEDDYRYGRHGRGFRVSGIYVHPGQYVAQEAVVQAGGGYHVF